ncbi:MAG: ISL3 family transposase [Bacteroidales bacterium]|nr:ISL3 family transposase [Bacteroidales bacterium]
MSSGKISAFGGTLQLPPHKICIAELTGEAVPERPGTVKPGAGRGYDPYEDPSLGGVSPYLRDLCDVVFPGEMEADPSKPGVLVEGVYHSYHRAEAVHECTHCGSVSTCRNGSYVRAVEMVPLSGGVRHVAHVRVRRRLCRECGKTYGAEVPGAERYGRWSREVLAIAFSDSLQGSSSDASRHLASRGISMSHDTINRLYSRIEVSGPTGDESEVVVIDDVAYRKGCSYMSIIGSAVRHTFLGLVEGRDGRNVSAWFREKGVSPKAVGRDRGSGLSAAVSDCAPDAVQVADRWHLLHNVKEHIRDAMKASLPAHVFFEGGVLAEGAPKRVDAQRLPPDAPEVLELDGRYDNTPPLDGAGNAVRVEIIAEKGGVLEREQAERRRRKKEDTARMRADFASGGVSKKELAGRYGISLPTLSRRLKMGEDEVESLDRKKRNGKMRSSAVDDHRNIIYKMLEDGVAPAAILSWCMGRGYAGSPVTLAKNIAAVSKNHFARDLKPDSMITSCYPPGVDAVSRLDIRRYMTSNDRSAMSEKPVAKYYRSIKRAYPVLGELENAWRDFYCTIMGSGPEWLDAFISRHENGTLANFVLGIKMDREAVRNAIIYDLSSGFMEGTNNLLKLVKRAMFGRASIKLLEKKMYAISQMRAMGKSASEILFGTS